MIGLTKSLAADLVGRKVLVLPSLSLLGPSLLLSLSAMLTQSYCNSYLYQHHDDNNNKDKNNKNDNLASGLRECGLPGHSGDSKLACKLL